MAALLGDAAVRDDQNLVGMTDRIEPVRNNQQRLALAQRADRLLDIALVISVHTGGGFVQNDNGRVGLKIFGFVYLTISIYVCYANK